MMRPYLERAPAHRAVPALGDTFDAVVSVDGRRAEDPVQLDQLA